MPIDSSQPLWAVALPILRLVLVTVAGATVVLAVVLAAFQSRLIYHPPHHGPEQRPAGPPGIQVIRYRTSEGQQQAYYVPPRRGGVATRTWLLFGGNASSAIGWGDLVQDCQDEQAAFLLADYPGYGANEGTPSPQSMRVAADAMVAALAEHLGVQEAALAPSLAVFGQSLGCAIALDYAAEHQVERIVLVAPFTTMLAMARRMVGWPLCEVLVHRFDNQASLARIIAAGGPPITIIHGSDDEVIPVAMGRSLAQRWPERIHYREIAGADHNSIIDEARSVIYAEMGR
jgi:pimeloyl-ACP methyl ester carboxylesterase